MYHRMRVGFENQKNVESILVTCFSRCSTGANELKCLEVQWEQCWMEGGDCTRQRLHRIRTDTRVLCPYGGVDLEQLGRVQGRAIEMILGVVKIMLSCWSDSYSFSCEKEMVVVWHVSIQTRKRYQKNWDFTAVPTEIRQDLVAVDLNKLQLPKDS